MANSQDGCKGLCRTSKQEDDEIYNARVWRKSDPKQNKINERPRGAPYVGEEIPTRGRGIGTHMHHGRRCALDFLLCDAYGKHTLDLTIGNGHQS